MAHRRSPFAYSSIGASAQLLGYCIQSLAPPFPLLVLGYAVNGFGLSLQAWPFIFTWQVLAYLTSGCGCKWIRGLLEGQHSDKVRSLVRCLRYVSRYSDDHYVLPNESHPGVGAFTAPLVATQFAAQKEWSFHYLVSLGITMSNLIVLIAVFRFNDQDCMWNLASLEHTAARPLTVVFWST